MQPARARRAGASEATGYAREHGPGLTITTILCDYGAKYLSKLYNPDWLATHGLDRNAPVPSWD